MGLKPGEKIERLGRIRVVSVSHEPLSLMDERKYGDREASLEGFPEMYGDSFVHMFCQHMGCDRDQIVTRIEFEYMEDT